MADSAFTRIRVDLGIRQAAPLVEGYASSPALPGMALRILGVDPFSEGPFRPFLSGGDSGLDVRAFLTTAGAVVMSATTAASAGVGVGDSLPEGLKEEAIAPALEGAYGGALAALKRKLEG